MPGAGTTRLARVLLLSLCAAACAQIREWLPFASTESSSISADPESTAPAAASAPTKAPAPQPRPAGTLLLSGGGPIAGKIIAEAARVTGGAGARVLVVPLASHAAVAGQAAAETWRKAGFTDVDVLDPHDPAHAAQQIESATFLWMTGGSEGRVAGKLLDAALADAVRRRHEAGAVVGGSSAGAAAVSERMLTGTGTTNGRDDDAGDEMVRGRVRTVPGLSLWPGVIVDQHFVAKRRFNRLMAAVLDHPHCVGIGIDEGTGVVVSGATLRVVGDGSVVVIDARRAKVTQARPGDASAATGVTMEVLSEGMTHDLGER